jgi:hypothetical protein
MSTIEGEVIEKARERQKYAPKKRNNVKRPVGSLYEVPAKDEVICKKCTESHKADQAELQALKARVSISIDEMVKIHTLEQSVSRGVPLLENDASGDCVCTGCGVVVDRSAALGTDYNDFERVCPGAKARTRENYMRERMSQWTMGEPSIPSVDREKLRAAFNRGFGSYPESDGVFEFDPALPKHTVREIIIRAGLSTKKYTEKWLTIRSKLLGADPHPLPSPDLVHFIIERFKKIVQIWQCNSSVLCPPGHGRKSLFNYNYIIRQLLLLHSVEAYNTHCAWFPVLASQKISAMDVMWRAVCVEAEWPCYRPIWGDTNVVGRQVETLINTRARRPVVKRRRVGEKARELKQPFIFGAPPPTIKSKQ